MYIDRKEITLAEVAELADMPESTLKTFIYNGNKDCHLSTAVKLARVFHISIDELVGAGTISPQTCESLQLVRQLPVSFTHFVRYMIHLHYRKLTEGEVTEKAIEIMTPSVSSQGSLVMTNKFNILDISGLSAEIRNKIFMGVKMVNDVYEPTYFEGDTLLIANDRKPRDGENVLIGLDQNFYVVKAQVEVVNGKNKYFYYSIRDGKLRSSEDRVNIIIGYVVKVV